MIKSNKIVFFDIETTPNVVYSWRIGFNLNLTHDNIVDERKIICISYKYAGDPYVYRLEWDNKQCDKKMIGKFIKVLKEVDVAVGHNGDKFDIKWLKTRAIILNLEPLNKIITIDTLKIARNTFNFNCNRLDYLGKLLVNDKKKDTGGYSLWTSVMDGDKKSLEKMGLYCDQDVVLLEKVFNRLIPHVNTLPVHLGVVLGHKTIACDRCGGKTHANRQYRNKNGTDMKVITCQSCGSSRSMALSKYIKLRREL
jgi:DNA polymerase elongation subunit (family B)